ncbi:MAG: hypothetical protein H7832_15060 [Magnetococcus sp. DMHC-6]
MTPITPDEIIFKIGTFVHEIFIENVFVSTDAIEYAVNISRSDQLMNDHFPGTSIIQCFLQGAMLLFYENQTFFDPNKDLFFLGGVRIKYLKPILLGHYVKFRLSNIKYVHNILLFEAKSLDTAGKIYARCSGSLSSKSRKSMEEVLNKATIVNNKQ